MRTLVIGDIHGALRALKQVLERCGYDKQYDKLIFLGDYVDGWSESAELVDYLITLQLENPDIIFIRGNHDVWCGDWLNIGAVHPYWLGSGSTTTIDSYIKSGYLSKDSHRDFFKNLHDYYIDDDNKAFVHGGFVSRKGVGYDPYRSDYHWDRDMWELAMMLHNRPSEGTKKSRRFEKHHEVYIGHSATINWKCKNHYPEYKDENQIIKNGIITIPMNRCNVWNIDTGGGWSGKLTALDIDTKKYWQSDFVKNLYPEEKGR